MFLMLQGAKPVPLLLSIAIGVALRFLVPIPSGITIQAWTLLSIFVSTITGKHLAFGIHFWASLLPGHYKSLPMVHQDM